MPASTTASSSALPSQLLCATPTAEKASGRLCSPSQRISSSIHFLSLTPTFSSSHRAQASSPVDSFGILSFPCFLAIFSQTLASSLPSCIKVIVLKQSLYCQEKNSPKTKTTPGQPELPSGTTEGWTSHPW